MVIHSLKQNCYNLRFTLGTAFVGIVILLSILFGLTTYLSVRSFIRQEIRQRLMDTVGVAALQIDAEIQLKQFIYLFNYGADLYLDRKWSEAIKVFKETCKKNPHDIPSQILLKRCSKYAKKTPPLDWSGAIVMQEK